MIVSLIAAIGKNGELGFEGKIPWHIPEDFKHFKQTTLGHHLVMGRKTFESIGKPLPGRKTIVLTRGRKKMEGVDSVDAASKALELCAQRGESEVFIAGGAEIYNLFMPHAQRLYISYVDFEGEADAIFPEINLDRWKEVSSEQHQPKEKSPGWCLKVFESL
tara:strand:- start:20777 stop:21262 length:486 start_codon:yes stop_codon:yes gene_type:complete